MKSVKNIFVYGTLMSGNRNHKYFKNSIISIEEGSIKAQFYHLLEYDCPTILKGDGEVIGELITYKDDDHEIEKSLDYLEGHFKGSKGNIDLYYDKIDIEVKIEGKSILSKVYMLTNHKHIKKIKIDNIHKWKEQV